MTILSYKEIAQIARYNEYLKVVSESREKLLSLNRKGKEINSELIAFYAFLALGVLGLILVIALGESIIYPVILLTALFAYPILSRVKKIRDINREARKLFSQLHGVYNSKMVEISEVYRDITFLASLNKYCDAIIYKDGDFHEVEYSKLKGPMQFNIQHISKIVVDDLRAKADHLDGLNWFSWIPDKSKNIFRSPLD